MPQDPDLYGQRTARKKKTELGLSNTLDFASQLQSLIKAKPKTGSNASTISGEKRSSTPLFASSSKKAKTETKDDKKKDKRAPWNKKAPIGGDAELDEAERERIRRNMAIKAEKYAQMQRGDYLPKEGEVSSLVDFDRKWAERREAGGSSGSDSEDNSDSDDNGGEQVEYVDEFGRTRTVSKARRERELRRQERAKHAAQDLADMRARPEPPPDESRLIFGDVIQTQAFEAAVDRPWKGRYAEDEDDKVAETHYRAQDDVRTRGAAFYAFATDDEKKRAEQMQALADERSKTEAARAERSAQLDARKQEMAARRAALAEKKAKKQADSFLDGLGQDLFGGGGDDDEKE
ncbi:hypothetical protein Sste5346_009417 [Sporothrix stenoceras]|uniref:Uncharacterized protein n=1 Tax=Sporothrix stenoceras TaxID=5173 RepID=A0ABR3YJY8_9PEZI